jgi:signal transduction histidine kinase
VRPNVRGTGFRATIPQRVATIVHEVDFARDVVAVAYLDSRISIRGLRASFLFVVSLLAAVAVFTLWGDVRTNEQRDALVSQAFTRDVLIGRIRVDALNLESAVDSHIRGTTEPERNSADERMARILNDISLASQEYTRDLPPAETEIWTEFNNTSHSLAAQVRKAVTFSNRKEADRARRHLVSEIRPITAALNLRAEQLSQKNAEVTAKMLRQVQEIRRRTTYLGAIVAGLAILISLLVGWQVTALLRRQQATIQAQLAELDRRNQELDSFASRVAHDLVSPISPLKGYLTLIRRSNSIVDPQVREMLSLAEASAARMTEMIEALLRFCRAGLPSEPTVGELDTAVSAILLEVGQTTAKEGVELERSLDAHVRVACPSQLLQSIAQNLLSNAVKYTAGRPEPRVTVRVWKEFDEAVLEVSDNGRGMSPATQNSLFQPFFRAPEARGLPGHGLGLATTKRLVEAHGGSISVVSELGVGTQLTVRFPLVPSPTSSDPEGMARCAPTTEESGPSAAEAL